MSVPREGAAPGERFATADVRSLFTHCCHCLNCQRQTGTALVINLLIETDRVQLLAGDHQPVEAPPEDGSTQRIFRCPTCQVAVYTQYGHPGLRLVRGGTLDQPLERWGRPRRACSGSSRDVGSHLRSVARFRWQCVQRLARCRNSCAVVSATSPEALRGRWHCLASDSSRES